MSMAAIIFALKNVSPDRWKEDKVETTNENTNKVTIEVHDKDL